METKPTNSNYYLKVLDEEFSRRKERDRGYSLRSYAEELDLNAGSLSSILLGKRMIPAKKVMSIVRKLQLTGERRRQFLESLPKGGPSPKDSRELEGKHFAPLFQEWEYFVILGMLRLEGFESSAEWISQRSAIPAERVEECIDQLFAMGLVRENEQGGWERTYATLHSTHDVPSVSIRASHRENLRLALSKIDSVPVEERDYSFLTVALDDKSFGKLKRLLLKMRDEVRELDEASSKQRLYRVAIQCFPLSGKKA